MNIRETMEQWERQNLSPYASLSSETLGRDREEPLCDIRPAYQRDRDRILHSKSFRRLKDKTQVFLAPEGDHYRTRLTHTLEVSQIARTIAKALRMNESLTEAIALGHDLGHTPFGHAGEYILNEICPEGFSHYKQSVRVVEILEKKGQGLNLTKEVRDGMLNHRTSGNPATMEGKIVRFSDKIAYINHDIDDAIRAGILSEEDLPKDIVAILGDSHKARINTLVCDLIATSREAGTICLTPTVDTALKDLRSFMFDHVYRNPVAKGEESKAKIMLQRMFEYYITHPDALPEDFQPQLSFDGMERTVCDYIAGMTDNYAVNKFTEIFVPAGWNIRG